MARLGPLSWGELVRRLRDLGFEGPYAGGRHPQMRRGELTLVLPNPHVDDIGVGVARPHLAASWRNARGMARRVSLTTADLRL